MKTFRVLGILIILGIGFVAALYPQRAVILDWYQELTKPELPAAVTYEQTQEAEEQKTDEIVELEEEKDVEEEVIDETPAAAVDDEAGEEDAVETGQDGEETSEAEDVEDEEEVVVLPDSVNLAVPFTSQAPDANWDEPYQEMCEEASLYMVQQYYAGEPEGLIPPEKANTDLLSIAAFEEELFGYYEDTTAEQVSVLAEMMYGFPSVELIQDPTIDQIKEQLAAGRPVLVPAAGRLLGNPNFTAPGPIYHMLVIRGYTQSGQFITNGPGTRKGEAYLYDFDTIMYAMHDWNRGEEITEGGKVVIVINP